MAQLGAGLGSGYPSTIDTSITQSTSTDAIAEIPNDHAAAIIAGQTTLGTNPHGTAADVKTYLQVEHNLDGTHKAIVDRFPQGGVTKLVFYQAAAPTGWTQVTTHNDKALRVVSGTGGGSGGTVGFAGIATGNASGDHTHAGPSHTHTGPSHSHSLTNGSVSDATTATGSVIGIGAAVNYLQTYTSSGSDGSFQSKTATTDAQGTGATSADGTGATAGQSATHTHTIAPQYIDVIVCQKT